MQFLNPWIMVKKGGKLPAGHINDWFWEDKSMQDYIATRLPKGACLLFTAGLLTILTPDAFLFYHRCLSVLSSMANCQLAVVHMILGTCGVTSEVRRRSGQVASGNTSPCPAVPDRHMGMTAASAFAFGVCNKI